MMSKKTLNLIHSQNQLGEKKSVYLSEYEEKTLDIKYSDLTKSDVDLFEDLKKEKILKSRNADDRLNVESFAFVGTAEFSNFRLNVIPKIFKDRKSTRLNSSH